MLVKDKHFRSIWAKNKNIIQIIDQRQLPHKFVIEDLLSVDDVTKSIKDMHVRGAPLIGVTAAYGMYLACLHAPETSFDDYVLKAAAKLKSTRPTAIDLIWAVDNQIKAITKGDTVDEKIIKSLNTANEIADEAVNKCKQIGEYGAKLIEKISNTKKGAVVNILTHCNAGWLACVDYGTATSPIYTAHDKGIKVHVWVDETRPRNQGARLTAWELGEHGIAHTIIVDNVGGHLMQHGFVDLVIVGTDRTTYTGDVANKIGTYLKALAAKDNNIPFYVALPSSTFDWNISNGYDIPIEQRGESEVKYISGLDEHGKITKVLLTPKSSPASNYAFDVTPARLVTGIITERGICEPNKESVLNLYPEKKNAKG